MKCPFCGDLDNKVIDSRVSKDGSVIRRRRECLDCTRRFTTYEHIEEIPIMIIKKDGRREVFSREKVRKGMRRACQKLDMSLRKVLPYHRYDLHAVEESSGQREVGGRAAQDVLSSSKRGLNRIYGY